MSTLLDLIAGQLSTGGATEVLSEQLGADPTATNQAIALALPVLLQALSKNASTPRGAEDLARALKKKHDGSLLEDLGGFLGMEGSQSMGAAILAHVLGSQRHKVETGIGKATGLDSSQVAMLLSMLAPIVMAQLGKTQRQEGLDPTDLSNVLTEQADEVHADPGAVLGGLAGMLDANKDGSIADEALAMGGQLLNMFAKSRS